MHDVEAYSEHSVSVGESQVRASKTAAATQRTHLCKLCFSVLKDILHLSELQVVHFEKNVFLSDACVRDLCFSANPHQQQKDASGEKPWKEDMESALLVRSCCFYLSGMPAASIQAGEDSPAISGLLQHQATLNTEEPHSNNEITQEFLSGKRHHQWVECEAAASQKLKVAYQKGLCSGDMIDEYNKCGEVCRRIFNHPQHGRVYTEEKPYECTDCGKVFNESTALIKHNRVHIREKQCECSDCGKSFRKRPSIKLLLGLLSTSWLVADQREGRTSKRKHFPASPARDWVPEAGSRERKHCEERASEENLFKAPPSPRPAGVSSTGGRDGGTPPRIPRRIPQL
ncbi:zinc finger protein 772-like [Myotis lucifugus]|uniref:zinc finger protein 772-like n=1 Tax=Myotis lucifugus TaxID=59463 RepID=UPI000CCC7EE1|nr:zinc finger protein 772-like [Myotis lucifugus]